MSARTSGMSEVRASALYNPDLAPVEPARRTGGTYNYAARWIGMSVQIPTYMRRKGVSLICRHFLTFRVACLFRLLTTLPKNWGGSG